MHDLPIRKMNQESTTLLAAPLGVIKQVSEGDNATGNGQCLRIRVRLDITKPLCRGRKARLEKGRETWVSSYTNVYPTFVIGVVVLPTVTKTTVTGFATRTLYGWRISSLAYG